MKSFISMIAMSLGIFLLFFVFTPSVNAQSIGECGEKGRTFLGMPSWDRGLPDCQDFVEQDGEGVLNINRENVNIIITNITAITIVFAGLIAFAFFLVGAFRYVLSSGNPQAASQALKTIINAGIGMVIAIMARIIVEIIFNYLKG